jgi:hypothetical protein
MSFEQINQSIDYAMIVDKIHKINLHSVNLNMMRTQRSESTEMILENTNKYSVELRDQDGVRLKEYKNTDSIINKFSLKLNDPNKEQLYNQQTSKHANVLSKLKILRLSILSYLVLLAINIYRLVLNSRSKTVSHSKS